jgi:hypothetical protein
MVKNKVIKRAKTNMTHNKKIEALAKESLFSLVLSFSLKPIIACTFCSVCRFCQTQTN